MAIELESFLFEQMNNGRLPMAQREHLRQMYEKNRNFIAENAPMYPKSPLDFGPNHIKSIIDIQLGEEYRIQQLDVDPEFLFDGEPDHLRIMRIKPNVLLGRGQFTVTAFVGKQSSYRLGDYEAFSLGLTRVPRQLLSTRQLEDATTEIWDSTVWVERIDGTQKFWIPNQV